MNKKYIRLSILAAVSLLISGCTGIDGGGIPTRPTRPTTSSPTTAPTSEVPTSVSTSELPTSEPTSSPTTEIPTSEPTSELPTSEPTSVPTTDIPTSEPTSEIPTSEPTSELPTSISTSEIPTSEPSSSITSEIPTSVTSEPTTSVPTSLSTSELPTSVPTTSIPTSVPTSVTTSVPTSVPISASTSSPTSQPTSTSQLEPEGYYDACEGLTGDSLANTLYSINQPKNPSYDWSRYEDADEAEDDSTSILSLYTRHNIKKSNHCGSYSWTTWNREHIWTQTKYPASKTDNHNIFACEGQINGYRSDKPFAEGGETVVVFGHTTGCKQTNSTFEPCDEAKGEVARSVMYGTVMYKYTMTQEINSIALALKWHLQFPVNSREIRRNNVVQKNQGNRNPFTDHPEYACKIWGNTNSETRSLCGM